jgi:arylsulfatase A-like enzyme
MMLFSKNLGDVVCVLGLVAVLGTANIATASEKPNVLVIMVDDLGYADLSSYGSTDLRTPNVDTLVSEGMRFNEFYSNSCVCSPTRAALLTGRFPDLVGMHGVTRKYANDSWGCLTPDSIMLPELFRKQGYLTSLIGKWHLGLQKHNLPNQRGFDEFHGFVLGMMDDYWEHSRQGMHQMRRNETPIYPKGHATDLISQWSIDRMKKDVAAGKPFFQFLAYNAPHFPVQPPAEWLKRVNEREKGLSKVRAYMVAFVEHLDHNIGLVLNTLDELGIRDNTIVVFTSDNGGLVKVGSNNGSLRGGKTQVYEGGIKVPACIRWPKHITAGQTTDFYALTMDILPTIAELCGVPIEHEIEGRSFADLVITGKQAPFNRINYHTWMQKYKTKECIRDGSWKLLNDRWQTLGKRNGVRFELYDLKDDPFEKNNLAKSMPEKAVELSKKLETHLELANKVNWKRPSD